MAAALRRLLPQRMGSIPVASTAMLLLVRCCSTAPSQSASASVQDYCYALGAFGKMEFSTEHFIPFDQYLKDNENSILEPVPTDRLISPVDENCNLFTSESAKKFIRSGYLAAHFAKTLNLSISGAFANGNVGVISGLNIIAFLKLDTELSSVPHSYPLTFSGFSSFLYAKMREVYSAPKARRMSAGLHELIQLPFQANITDSVIIYHPEFLSHEDLAGLYIEAHRILRKQMPSTGKDAEANLMIMHLQARLGIDLFDLCGSHAIISVWLGQWYSQTGLLGTFDLSAPPGAPLDLTLLSKGERKKMRKLTAKGYGISPSASPKPPPGRAVYKRDPSLDVNPTEARVLDTHRHCMVHLVEDASVAVFFKVLPKSNTTSLFEDKKLCLRDGVQLMLYNFGTYPHHVAVTFHKFGIWDSLDLASRCPIPEIFYSPQFRHVPVQS